MSRLQSTIWRRLWEAQTRTSRRLTLLLKWNMTSSLKLAVLRRQTLLHVSRGTRRRTCTSCTSCSVLTPALTADCKLSKVKAPRENARVFCLRQIQLTVTSVSWLHWAALKDFPYRLRCSIKDAWATWTLLFEGKPIFSNRLHEV